MDKFNPAIEIVRLLGETSKSYAAKCDFLRMDPGERSLHNLAHRYKFQTEPVPPTRDCSTLKIWSSKFNWVEEARIFDQQIAAAVIDEQIRERKIQYRAQLEEFSVAHRQLGKQSVASALKLCSRLYEFCEKQKDLPLDPEDSRKATELAKILQSIHPFMDYWGKSLCIESVLDGTRREPLEVD